MNLELAIFGIITGLTSGFLVLRRNGFSTNSSSIWFCNEKEAVAISIMQNGFFFSLWLFLNAKKAKNVIKDGTILGIGGSIGGIASGYMLSSISNESLQYLLYLFLYFLY